MRLRKRLLLGTTVALLTACLGTSLIGCGSAGSGGSPPAGPAVGGGGDGGGGGGGGGGAPQATVVVGGLSNTVTAGGSTITVTATVTAASGGAAPDGTAVVFAASPTLGATIVPAAPGTTAGTVTATFRATRAGTYNITARALSVTSSRFAVTSLAPTVALDSNPTVVATQAGSGGGTVWASVLDHLGQPMAGLTSDQLTFSTTRGTVSGFVNLGGGVYVTTLTSTQTGTARVTGAAFDGSDSVDIEVVSDALHRLTLTTNPSQVEPNGESELTIDGWDRFDNPVTLATVDLAVDALGAVLPASVDLAGGHGTARFTAGAAEGTATITASSGLVEVTKSIPIVRNLEGEPVHIAVAVTPSGGRLAIKGVGGTEQATITATVTDFNGAPIVNQQGNIEFEILSGPEGGERFVPSDPGFPTLYTPASGTVGGIAHATFQSGTKAGTVTIQVRVVKDKNGVPLADPIIATIPNLLGVSGPPVNLFLGQSTWIIDNKDGTYTLDYFATVVDENGNGVPGVSVSFGQFSNIKASGDDGQIQEGNTGFTGTFLASQVRSNDILAVLSGPNQGGFSIAGASGDGALSVLTPFSATQGGLDFAIGNNLGTAGPVITPAGDPITDEFGKVTWHNRVPVELINAPLVVYAETSGRGVGKARSFRNPWVAPTKVAVLEGWESARAGDVLTFRVIVTDGGFRPIPIPDCAVNVAVDVPAASVGVDDGDLNSTGLNRVTVYTESDGDNVGQAVFYWKVPSAPTKASYKITITSWDGSIQQTIAIE